VVRVILTKGLPGSGKTTWAKRVIAESPGAYKRVNKDELRVMLDAGRWSPGNERFVEAVRDQIILAAVDAGRHVIVDDTNLDPRHETHIRRLVDGRAEVVVEDFDVPLDECIRRDGERPDPVGERVIRQMYRDFLALPAGRPPAPPTPPPPDVGP
jgi:tRNA uridine 5-carbamoylmethylation protein Kti12